MPKTAMDWEIYPDGLHHFLTRLAREYTGDTPLFVTENGLASYDVAMNGAVQDPSRLNYLESHLDAVKNHRLTPEASLGGL